MPLQTWDVVVHGRSHRVEIDRNPESGKQLLRVDGRVALKPFAEPRAEIPVTIDGKSFLFHARDGSYELEDRGSRYHDASAPRPGGNIGRLTICRGLEGILLVTDDALVHIAKLSEGVTSIGAAAAGGGILGALAAQAAARVAQKVMDASGPKATLRAPLRSLAMLEDEVTGHLEQLPFDLVALFSDEIDLACPVRIIPRRAIRGLQFGRASVSVETGTAAKPHKFDLAVSREGLEHLCAANYPMEGDDLERAGALARQQRAERAANPEPPPQVAAAPPQSGDPVPALVSGPTQQLSGLPEVRLTAPLVTVIGSDAGLLAEMETDAPHYAGTFPKTLRRRRGSKEPFRDLGREHYDIVHLLGRLDDKARFREPPLSLSLKDLIVKLMDDGVRALWLGSANDPVVAQETLTWAAAQRFFVVFTLVRGTDYGPVLGSALARLAAGEPLTRSLPDLETRSACRFRTCGRAETVFRS